MADAAIAERRLGLVPVWGARLLAALAERLAAERNRHVLWLPVFFGAGIGVYFALRVEPPLWPGVVAAAAGAVVSLAMHRHRAWCGSHKGAARCSPPWGGRRNRIPARAQRNYRRRDLQYRYLLCSIGYSRRSPVITCSPQANG